MGIEEFLKTGNDNKCSIAINMKNSIAQFALKTIKLIFKAFLERVILMYTRERFEKCIRTAGNTSRHELIPSVKFIPLDAYIDFNATIGSFHNQSATKSEFVK